MMSNAAGAGRALDNAGRLTYRESESPQHIVWRESRPHFIFVRRAPPRHLDAIEDVAKLSRRARGGGLHSGGPHDEYDGAMSVAQRPDLGENRDQRDTSTWRRFAFARTDRAARHRTARRTCPASGRAVHRFLAPGAAAAARTSSACASTRRSFARSTRRWPTTPNAANRRRPRPSGCSTTSTSSSRRCATSITICRRRSSAGCRGSPPTSSPACRASTRWRSS